MCVGECLLLTETKDKRLNLTSRQKEINYSEQTLSSLRYDTIEEFNVDSKAEYTA